MGCVYETKWFCVPEAFAISAFVLLFAGIISICCWFAGRRGHVFRKKGEFWFLDMITDRVTSTTVTTVVFGSLFLLSFQLAVGSGFLLLSNVDNNPFQVHISPHDKFIITENGTLVRPLGVRITNREGQGIFGCDCDATVDEVVGDMNVEVSGLEASDETDYSGFTYFKHLYASLSPLPSEGASLMGDLEEAYAEVTLRVNCTCIKPFVGNPYRRRLSDTTTLIVSHTPRETVSNTSVCSLEEINAVLPLNMFTPTRNVSKFAPFDRITSRHRLTCLSEDGTVSHPKGVQIHPILIKATYVPSTYIREGYSNLDWKNWVNGTGREDLQKKVDLLVEECLNAPFHPCVTREMFEKELVTLSLSSVSKRISGGAVMWNILKDLYDNRNSETTKTAIDKAAKTLADYETQNFVVKSKRTPVLAQYIPYYLASNPDFDFVSLSPDTPKLLTDKDGYVDLNTTIGLASSGTYFLSYSADVPLSSPLSTRPDALTLPVWATSRYFYIGNLMDVTPNGGIEFYGIGTSATLSIEIGLRETETTKHDHNPSWVINNTIIDEEEFYRHCHFTTDVIASFDTITNLFIRPHLTFGEPKHPYSYFSIPTTILMGSKGVSSLKFDCYGIRMSGSGADVFVQSDTYPSGTFYILNDGSFWLVLFLVMVLVMPMFCFNSSSSRSRSSLSLSNWLRSLRNATSRTLGGTIYSIILLLFAIFVQLQGPTVYSFLYQFLLFSSGFQFDLQTILPKTKFNLASQILDENKPLTSTVNVMFLCAFGYTVGVFVVSYLTNATTSAKNQHEVFVDIAEVEYVRALVKEKKEEEEKEREKMGLPPLPSNGADPSLLSSPLPHFPIPRKGWKHTRPLISRLVVDAGMKFNWMVYSLALLAFALFSLTGASVYISEGLVIPVSIIVLLLSVQFWWGTRVVSPVVMARTSFTSRKKQIGKLLKERQKERRKMTENGSTEYGSVSYTTPQRSHDGEESRRERKRERDVNRQQQQQQESESETDTETETELKGIEANVWDFWFRLANQPLSYLYITSIWSSIFEIIPNLFILMLMILFQFFDVLRFTPNFESQVNPGLFDYAIMWLIHHVIGLLALCVFLYVQRKRERERCRFILFDMGQTTNNKEKFDLSLVRAYDNAMVKAPLISNQIGPNPTWNYTPLSYSGQTERGSESMGEVDGKEETATEGEKYEEFLEEESTFLAGIRLGDRTSLRQIYFFPAVISIYLSSLSFYVVAYGARTTVSESLYLIHEPATISLYHLSLFFFFVSYVTCFPAPKGESPKGRKVLFWVYFLTSVYLPFLPYVGQCCHYLYIIFFSLSSLLSLFALRRRLGSSSFVSFVHGQVHSSR